MLRRGTLPSRRELEALIGESTAASGGSAGNPAGGPISMLSAVERNLPRLDQYLHSGLGIRDSGRRDAILTAAVLPFVEGEVADDSVLDDATLFSALRRAACIDGMAAAVPEMPRSGSASLRVATRLTTREVRTAAGRYASATRARRATTVAAATAMAVIAAPIWFVEPELSLRFARAHAIFSAAIAATSPFEAGQPAPVDLEARADELARAYENVWKSLPAATVEARMLWELGLSVQDIARVLGVSPAAIDTALLQLLTANRVFNTLVGRESVPELSQGVAVRSCERLLRGML